MLREEKEIIVGIGAYLEASTWEGNGLLLAQCDWYPGGAGPGSVVFACHMREYSWSNVQAFPLTL